MLGAELACLDKVQICLVECHRIYTLPLSCTIRRFRLSPIFAAMPVGALADSSRYSGPSPLPRQILIGG